MVVPRLPSTPGQITTVAVSFRDQLDRNEARAVVQMERSYRRAIDSLYDDLTQLERMIADRQASGQPTPVSWLHRQQKYKTLILKSRDAFDSYGGAVRGVLDQSQKDAIRLASRSATSLIEAALPGRQGLVGTYNSIPTRAVERLRGALSKGSPLTQLIDGFGPTAANAIDAELTNGLVKGLHPNTITRRILSAASVSRTRAATITRTELYRAFREGNRATYQANADVVNGWVWFAHIGPNTCAACLAMHGSVFPTDEPMGSHPNCRCTMLPETKSWSDLGFPDIDDTPISAQVPNAEDWLRNAAERTQKAAFGNLKLWRGWRDREFDLADVVRRVDTDAWGTTRTISGYDAALARATARRAALPPKPARKPRKPRAVKPTIEQVIPQVDQVVPQVVARTVADDIRDRIAQGVATEVDVRDVGRLLRREIENRTNARSARLSHEIGDLEADMRADLARIDALKDEQAAVRDLLGKDADDVFFRTSEEISAIRTRMVAKRERLFELEQQKNAQFLPPEIAREVLREVRPGFGESTAKLVGKKAGHQRVALKHLQDQAENFPKEWFDEFATRQIKTKVIQRGYFRQGMTEVDVMLSPYNPSATAIHELTHFAEYMRPRIRELEWQFYNRRTAGERLSGMSWSNREVTRRDQFVSEYMGKDYGNSPDSYFELATMGVESIFAPTRRYDITPDPEYADFVLGLLAAL